MLCFCRCQYLRALPDPERGIFFHSEWKGHTVIYPTIARAALSDYICNLKGEKGRSAFLPRRLAAFVLHFCQCLRAWWNGDNIQSCFDFCRAALWSRRFFGFTFKQSVWFNQVENEEERRAIFLHGLGALSVAGVELFSLQLCALLKMRVAHWFYVICPAIVVPHGNTVKALSGTISRRGKRLGNAGANPIVFSPMWGEGDWMVGACVCLCLWITKFSLSSPAAPGHNVVAEAVVFGAQ